MKNFKKSRKVNNVAPLFNSDAPSVNYANEHLEHQLKQHNNEIGQKIAAAQCELAKCYMRGVGLPKNWSKALECYRLAASEYNYAPAQHQLGKCLYDENLDENDKLMQEGLEWLTKSAKQNYMPAAAELAIIYENLNDTKNFLKYCTAAAKLGFTYAQRRLAEYYGDDIFNAGEWLILSAKRGYVDAYKKLENVFKDDEAFLKYPVIGAQWLHILAEEDDIEAMIKLGNCYQKGIGVPVDYAAAIQWHFKAVTHRKNKLIGSMQEIVLSINELAQRYATPKH